MANNTDASMLLERQSKYIESQKGELQAKDNQIRQLRAALQVIPNSTRENEKHSNNALQAISPIYSASADIDFDMENVGKDDPPQKMINTASSTSIQPQADSIFNLLSAKNSQMIMHSPRFLAQHEFNTFIPDSMPARFDHSELQSVIDVLEHANDVIMKKSIVRPLSRTSLPKNENNSSSYLPWKNATNMSSPPFNLKTTLNSSLQRSASKPINDSQGIKFQKLQPMAAQSSPERTQRAQSARTPVSVSLGRALSMSNVKPTAFPKSAFTSRSENSKRLEQSVSYTSLSKKSASEDATRRVGFMHLNNRTPKGKQKS